MNPDPALPWSSNSEQDTRDATREAAVQVRPHGSIIRPKALTVREAAPKVVAPLMVERHYLRSFPAAAAKCYGVFHDRELVGGVVFTPGPRLGHRLLAAARPNDVLCLARLYLLDEVGRNAESRVLGVVLRHLRSDTDCKLVLSYSDPVAGHRGIVYQAAGFLYLGMTEPGTYVTLADGMLHHPRTIFNRYGSNNTGHLRATGVPAGRVRTPGKHRYVFLLRPERRWRLKVATQPFPKARGRGPPAADL